MGRQAVTLNLRRRPACRESGWAPRQYAAVMALVVLAVAGCASKLVVLPPASVAGSITAAAALNPSASQRPSPLLLRVYELRGATAFNQAEFMALYQADQATLGAELLARDELTLQPGESRPYARQLHADTRFIGVVGVYRDLEHARWRAIVPVQPARAQKLTIRADSLAVSATVFP